MTINQLIDSLKSKGEFAAAGTVAAVNGKERSYGCHFGMKSGRQNAMEEFYAAYDSFLASLKAAGVKLS
jgi:hypothetical protein